MSHGSTFDFYDERWYDCWLAATSVARSRKKHTDLNIPERVGRLFEDFGPESRQPLTLRIFGMMIKGFSVINNERARALFSDCERVVLMFARQPFADDDNKIRFPAAKRPRMEAALTLDIDLAKIEALEAFDWTQAPLEEGALLRLGGGGLLEEAPQQSVGHGGVDDPMGMMQPLLPDAAAGAMMLSGASDAGWLPSLGGIFGEPPGPDTANVHAVPPPAAAAAVPEAPAGALGALAVENGVVLPAAQPLEPLMTDLMVPQADPVAALPADAGGQAGAPPDALQMKVRAPPRRRVVPLHRPGLVYGVDEESTLRAAGHELCPEGSSAEFTLDRRRASMYVEDMDAEAGAFDHFGPHLRLLVDPADSTFQHLRRPRPAESAGPAAATAGDALPEVQSLLSAGVTGGMDPTFAAPPEAVAAAAIEPCLLGLPPEAPPAAASEAVNPALAIEQAVPPPEVFDPVDLARLEHGAAEVQDDRTMEVGAIIRGCLRGSDLRSAAFHELVPPGNGGADRATAARSFAALLSLAGAGEFCVAQAEPFGPIQISETA